MEKSYKSCQSCGMPMKQDSNKGGTNFDGTKSLMYCSYCYSDGDGQYLSSDKDRECYEINKK